jgi:hypothetical protein
MVLAQKLELVCDIATFLGVLLTIAPTYRVLALQRLLSDATSTVTLLVAQTDKDAQADLIAEIAEAKAAIGDFLPQDRRLIVSGLTVILFGFFCKLISYLA